MKRFAVASVLAIAMAGWASAQSLDAGIDDPAQPARWFATFSIIAFDPSTGDLGVGVQSHAFTAGAAVPYAIPGVGAVATQAAANRLYGPKAIELLRQGVSPAEVVKANPNCTDFIEYPAAYTYMRQWAQLNIAETWKKVTAPVLIVYGTSDFVASTGDHPYLADMLNSFHPGQATLKAIAGMDHYMTKAASMEASLLRTDGVQGEFDPEILTVVQEWLDTSRK